MAKDTDPEGTSYTKALNPHSVVIKTSAKGDVSWEVKCYGDTPDESKDMAIKIFDELKAKYSKDD